MLNKLFRLAILFILLNACNQNDAENKIEEIQNSSFHWLLGSWTRTNDKPNKQTFENWEKISNKEYIGLGYTLQNSDTTFKENLRIVNSNDVWTLEVRGVNENMTPFIFTNLTASSFTCENQQNEFPKKIKYSLKENILKAVISADSIQVLFTFTKKKFN